MLRGCLFEFPNSFQTLKVGSPNKHLEAWGQLRSLEAHKSVCNTGSSEAWENQLREFSQKLPRLPLLSEAHKSFSLFHFLTSHRNPSLS
jgi:hypothetical protein